MIREVLGLSDDVREYALIRRRGQPDDPSKVKSYNRKKSPYEVELEEDLPVGRYVLQEIKGNGDFGAQLWAETLFGEEAEVEEALERSRRAEQAAVEAREKASSANTDIDAFENPTERLKFQIQSTIVEDEDLLKRYGDELVGWALSNGLSPDADVQISSLPSLIGYESFREPQQAGELAKAISEGISEGFEMDHSPKSVSEAFGRTGPESGLGGASSGALDPTGPSSVGEVAEAFDESGVGDADEVQADDSEVSESNS